MIMTKILNFIKKYPFSILTVIVIIYLSLFKPTSDKLLKINNIDKVAHFIMYAGFCAVLWFEYLRSHRVLNYKKIFLWAVVCPIFFSGFMEIAQGLFTKDRSGDWFDFLFNFLGVVSAALFGNYILKPVIRKKDLRRNVAPEV